MIADELRVQLSRWSGIRRRLLADRRLRTDLPTIWNALDAACRRLGDLSRAAIRWTRRLVRIGFRVLAHADLDRIGADTLWNVARGLEQFNWLTSAPQRNEFRLGGETSWRRSYRPTSRRYGPVTLSTVLRLLANERSKYAAASAVEHFAANPQFLGVVLGRGPRIPSPSWLPLVLAETTGDGAARTAVPDGLMVEDAAGQPSPLIDFNRRETTFAARFLHVVCHSTSLIRPSSVRESRPNATAELATGLVDDCVVVRAGRKNVSWGDTSLSVAVQQTVRRYVDDIWRRFARHLVNFLVNLEWKETRRESRGRLGSVVVCPYTATLLLQRVIQQAADDGKMTVLSLLARLMGQNCFARCRLSASVVSRCL